MTISTQGGTHCFTRNDSCVDVNADEMNDKEDHSIKEEPRQGQIAGGFELALNTER